ncbi:MAG TPA: hypothetical protein DEQ34_12765 [Balneolaceae bacterium]|nr:hypothetical protein [Balneolaceae bacterium]|tara:strand:- start:122549 stop:123007 length:459 start_codon:yes stop_codon:yes gene_type:complete
MQIEATTPDEYLSKVPEDRKEVMSALRDAIKNNLPQGFEETMNYGMIGYVVPHSKYPEGYHVDPNQPLPFINLASQKNHIAVYHSCVYADEDLMNWFREEYAKRVPTKLDMGKSCIRFKNPKKVPVDLIAELATKVTPDEWIQTYESVINRK